MPEEQELIDALGDIAVGYAAEKWGLSPHFARHVIEKAIKDKLISARLPQAEFIEYVQLVAPQPISLSTRLASPAPKFSWLILLVCAAVFSPSFIFPNSQTFFGGLATLIFTAYSLYHKYFTASLRTNLRASFWLWLFFFVSMSMMMAGFGEMVSPFFSISTSPPARTNTSTPHPTATRNRPPTITPEPCLHWSQITPQMKGRQVCVYGVISNVHANYQAEQSFIYFGSEDQFFVTNEFKWDDLKGCVQVDGVIGLNTYRVPYINTSDFYDCDPWMQ